MWNKIRQVVWCLAWLGIFTGVSAVTFADDHSTPRVLRSEADRLIVELPNRLLVVVQEVHTAPVASAQVWVKTGSIYEQEHVGAGLSHFLEHLLSGGSTSQRSEEESRKILGSIGAQSNASTGLDAVHYYINTTSADVPQAIDLLSDWMQHSLITPEEYAREREVIQNEFAMGEGDPARILWKLTQQVRYRTHPARHPTIGYIDEFLTITRDQIYDFYKRMYVPNNMVFVVVGDVDKRKVVDQITGLWAAGKPGQLPRLSFPVEPEIDSPRQAQGTADIRRPRLRLAWPGTQLAQDGDYALDLLAVILGQGEASQLVQVVRDQDKSVNTVSAYNMSFHWGKGYFGIDSEVVVSPENSPPKGSTANPEPVLDHALAKAGADILRQVEKVRTQGITAAELARAKRQTIAQVVYSAQTDEGLASRLAGDMIAMDDPDYLQRYALAIQAVTAEDVQAAAQKYLRPDRLITVQLLPRPQDQQPQPLTRPAEDAAAANFPRVPVEIDNTQLVTRLAELADKPVARPSAGQVQAIERFVLPNGLRLLVERNTRVPAVAIQFYQLGGLLADQPGQEGVAYATATMLLKGTATRNAQQLAREIEDLGADLSTSGANNTWFSRALCLKEDWSKVMGIMADVVLHPTFPEDEWSRLKPRLLAGIDRQRDSWNGELRQNFLQAYYGQHPWSVTPIGRRDVVAQLTSQDLAHFHAGHLGASDAVLAVFGDVEPKEVAALAGKLFADLPKQPLLAFRPTLPQTPQARLVQVPTNKPLAAVQIGYGPGLVRQSADYPAMNVLARVLSSFPAGWLDEELRGRGPGLVYAVGAGQSTGLVPGYFAVLFNSNPAQAPEAIRRAQQQVERLRTQLVGQEDLTRAKAAVLTDEFMDKQSNSDRAADAALNELYGLGSDAPARFLQTVRDLAPDNLRVVAQTYLRNPVVVVLTHEPLSLEPATTQP